MGGGAAAKAAVNANALGEGLRGAAVGAGRVGSVGEYGLGGAEGGLAGHCKSMKTRSLIFKMSVGSF